MKTKDLFKKIVDLVLMSEDSTSDWIKDKKLKSTSYLLFSLLGIYLFYKIFVSLMFYEQLSTSSINVKIYRIISVTFELLIIASFIILTINYYIFIINKKIHIKLINILSFYIISIIIFGYIYFDLFLINPDFFLYNDSNLPDLAILKPGIDAILLRAEFVLFSAIQTINGNFFKIQTNSIFSSIISFLQSLYTLSLIVLFISSYVNQKTQNNTKL